MKNRELVLAIDSEGNKITEKNLKKWIQEKNKVKLADFFNRFYIRYLKPFEFNNSEFIKSYKNGFTIMTSCCLLIESYVSFTHPKFKDNKNKSERSFGFFFLKNNEFYIFSKGGLSIEEYEESENKHLKNRGIPKDFYKNVRCGILHNGETRNKWKILRKGKLFDEENKSINATLFMKNLIIVLKKHQNQLKNSDFNQDEIWKTYISRLNYLIEKSYRY